MLFRRSGFHLSAHWLLLASVHCSLGCSHGSHESPFTAAETNAALAPARELRPRCYAPSALARAGEKIVLDFKLDVEPTGAVHAIPTFAEPDDPEVIECVRHQLNAIQFPARGRDRLPLHFAM